ncbi:Cathepsin propeptide inhibitor domain-containing protein [Plasmodiophora brassicae]
MAGVDAVVGVEAESYVMPVVDTDNAREVQFQAWMSEHGKGYPTVDEYHKRLRIFSDNVDYIERTNAAGGPTRVKLNKYADLTLGEFKAANFRMPDHRRHKQA